MQGLHDVHSILQQVTVGDDGRALICDDLLWRAPHSPQPEVHWRAKLASEGSGQRQGSRGGQESAMAKQLVRDEML